MAKLTCDLVCGAACLWQQWRYCLLDGTQCLKIMWEGIQIVVSFSSFNFSKASCTAKKSPSDSFFSIHIGNVLRKMGQDSSLPTDTMYSQVCWLKIKLTIFTHLPLCPPSPLSQPVCTVTLKSAVATRRKRSTWPPSETQQTQICSTVGTFTFFWRVSEDDVGIKRHVTYSKSYKRWWCERAEERKSFK